MRNFEEYVKTIIESEDCTYMEKLENGYQSYLNDEIDMQCLCGVPKPNLGEMCISFRDEINLERNDKSVLKISVRDLHRGANYMRYFFALGNGKRTSLYINTSDYSHNCNQFIEIHTCFGSEIKIKVSNVQSEEKSNNGDVKVLIYENEDVIEEIGIAELSVESIINKIRKLISAAFIGDNHSDKYNRLFEIAKPVLYMRLLEVIKNWRKLITAPIREVQEKLKKVEEQLEELDLSRALMYQYLLTVDEGVLDMLDAAEREDSRIGKK